MLLIFIQNATTYSTLIKNLCNGTSTGGVCANANSSINPTCLASLNGSDTSACTRTCGTQLAALVTACDNVSKFYFDNVAKCGLIKYMLSSIFHIPALLYVLHVHKELHVHTYLFVQPLMDCTWQ